MRSKHSPTVATLLSFGVAVVLSVPTASADAVDRVQASAGAGVLASQAQGFVDSQGVATHVTYPGEYADKAMLEQRLVESGIKRVRASWAPEDTANRDLAVRLGKRGLRIMFWTGQIGSDLNRVKQAIKQTNALAPGTIDSVEGPNEQDNDPRLRDFVKQYHDVLKADPATSGLRLYGPSMANVGSTAPYNALGDISAWVDAANVHDYPGGRMMSDAYIDTMYAFTRANTAGSGKIIASELGYSNATGAASQPHPAVPQDVSAVLLPRIYLEHFRRGISETYLYELVDQSREIPWEAGFGLLNSDFTPKPAFTAIKNMNSLLADPGPAFAPGRLDYTLSGTDANTRTQLLQKRDGTFWLALWQQSEVWDRVTKQYTGIADIPVSITLPTSAAFTAYRPVTSTAPTRTAVGSTAVVSSGTSPTLVQIVPNGVTPPPVLAPAPAPSPAVGAGVTFTARINSGGGAITDAEGLSWDADTGYSGGTAYVSPASGLSGPASDSRFGTFTYSVPVPAPGLYRVRLHATETHWEQPGARVFSAAAEGIPVLTKLDLVARVGKNRTHVEEASVYVDDGALTLSLSAQVNHATLDGFEVLSSSAEPSTSPPSTPRTGMPAKLCDSRGTCWEAEGAGTVASAVELGGDYLCLVSGSGSDDASKSCTRSRAAAGPEGEASFLSTVSSLAGASAREVASAWFDVPAA